MSDEEAAGTDEIDGLGEGPSVVPFEPRRSERERRSWPCADEEKDLCEAAGEALDAAHEKWQQANARHNARITSAINRTRAKTDMPEINATAGDKFFVVTRKGDRWEEVFEHEVPRG